MSHQITHNQIVFNTINDFSNAVEELFRQTDKSRERYYLYLRPEVVLPVPTVDIENWDYNGQIIIGPRSRKIPSHRKFTYAFNPCEQYPGLAVARMPTSKTRYIETLNLEGFGSCVDSWQVIINTKVPGWERFLRVFFWTTNSIAYEKDQFCLGSLQPIHLDIAKYIGYVVPPPIPFDSEPYLAKLFDSKILSLLLKKLASY